MGAKSTRYVTLIALQVIDHALYAQYRAGMMPILKTYGGAFGYDFVIADVLKSEVGEDINRIFTISFPDQQASVRFFADEDYRRVREAFFKPAVASTIMIAAWNAAAT